MINKIKCIFYISLCTLLQCSYATLELIDKTSKGYNNENNPTANVLANLPFQAIHSISLINPIVFSPENNKEFVAFFKTNGYVVIDGISSEDDRTKLVKLIDKLASENIPGTRRLAFMDLYHDQTLANLRQNETLYEVFTHIYETKKLWSVFDRVIYWNKAEAEMPLPPHVDQNPITDPDFSYVQAMIALNDMNDKTGTLALIPKSHIWFDTYKKWANSKVGYVEYQNENKLDFVALNLKAGQLVIWDSRVTHSRFRGNPEANRYATLITYTKAIDSEELLQLRQQYYTSGIGYNNHAAGLRATANPRYNQSLRETPEQLTELGKKLYGITSWFKQ